MSVKLPVSPHTTVRAWLTAMALCLTVAVRADTVLYQTGFNASEGYNAGLDLVGQKGWLGLGSGGNGLLNAFFAGQGQQAYVGFAPPAAGDDSLFVYQIIDFLPTSCTATNIRFTVDTAVYDSSNNNYDYFYWAVFNSNGDSLAVLEFDNYTTNISYAYDGQATFLATGKTFVPNQKYRLTMDLDFPGNKWSAKLDSTVLVNNAPLTTAGAARSLGDIDAAFVVFDTAAPGDNFMVFDNYQIVAQPGLPAPARLNLLGRTATTTTLRVTARPGCAFVVDATSDFKSWTPIRTNTPAASGYFDMTDSSANPAGRRFYRARWLP